MEKYNKKNKKKRCNVCNKKVTIISFTCKCSQINLYCSKHRMPELHSCTYDWVKEGKDKIMKENPKIKTSTLEKIK